ncbi:hypothetical protein CI105_02445 [Candidatus Izimaplasma bacterium ZiA1]|uniref:methionine ABC transporter permease n=1 Tax=Candidatus Izimoplasma sp. ZiA1 TaxID=2024899 RepID=UPI000BAA5B20|nr:hypothetical protein CI105_02445 [Candidatus Izimaplasma bacterium ZiA1]
MFSDLELDLFLKALYETVYMSFIATIFVCFFGLLLGIFLYLTSENGMLKNKYAYLSLSFFTSLGRSIPFLILIVLLIPFTRLILGTILGPSAALPALIIGATPFYGRIVELSLHEKGKELVETGLSFGANTFNIVLKILIPESLPSLIRGLTVTTITIISYTSIAGAIGAGGLGNLAYLYGYARNKIEITIIATFLIVILIIFVQLIGDITSKKLSKK